MEHEPTPWRDGQAPCRRAPRPCPQRSDLSSHGLIPSSHGPVRCQDGGTPYRYGVTFQEHGQAPFRHGVIA